MKTMIRNSFVLTAALVITATLSSRAPAQCPLSVSISYTPVQELSTADIDFEHFESRTLLFTARALNQGGTTIQARLRISVEVALADGTPPFSPAVEYRSVLFPIPPEGRTITNLQLGASGSGPGHLGTEEYTFDERAHSRLQDIALGTGKFPSGVYSFLFQLLCENGTVISGEPPMVLILANPTRIELRSPRDGETTGQFPFFEFYHEGSRVVLTVAEKSPDQTREDAIVRIPPMVRAELMGQNSFLYTGGRPLEEGKTYVWNVVSVTMGPGGSESQVVSPVGLFTVSSSLTLQDMTDDELLRLLEELLGKRYPGIFTEIRSNDFALTGRFLLNGTPLSRAELLALVAALRTSADTIDLNFE